MNDVKLEELQDIFDDRYIKKEDLEKQVNEVASKKYASKQDLLEAIGKIEAMQVEQTRNTEMLNKIYEIVISIQEDQSQQKAKLALLATDVEIAKKVLFRQVWESLPRIVRVFVITISIFLLLIIFSALIGETANQFMQTNGLYVAVATATISYLFSRKE
ncbi:hypothetical protein BCR22_07435 [Enterococcus plantarum]|uniref:hypothetical protein n=1 Tax=Enterococcus TaxID=1350 RepID=UPI00084D84C1|nr:hypothetical protein [Enterococcus plantarum]OEG09419.1 hypothetical protein BCR22_07435 [Enterococcus plantarum]